MGLWVGVRMERGARDRGPGAWGGAAGHEGEVVEELMDLVLVTRPRRRGREVRWATCARPG